MAVEGAVVATAWVELVVVVVVMRPVEGEVAAGLEVVVVITPEDGLVAPAPEGAVVGVAPPEEQAATTIARIISKPNVVRYLFFILLFPTVFLYQ